jgi:hypothetical protein
MIVSLTAREGSMARSNFRATSWRADSNQGLAVVRSDHGDAGVTQDVKKSDGVARTSGRFASGAVPRSVGALHGRLGFPVTAQALDPGLDFAMLDDSTGIGFPECGRGFSPPFLDPFLRQTGRTDSRAHGIDPSQSD